MVNQPPRYTPILNLKEAADAAFAAWPDAFATRLAEALATAK
jgi:hypothetical protein